MHLKPILSYNVKYLDKCKFTPILQPKDKRNVKLYSKMGEYLGVLQRCCRCDNTSKDVSPLISSAYQNCHCKHKAYKYIALFKS